MDDAVCSVPAFVAGNDGVDGATPATGVPRSQGFGGETIVVLIFG